MALAHQCYKSMVVMAILILGTSQLLYSSVPLQSEELYTSNESAVDNAEHTETNPAQYLDNQFSDYEQDDDEQDEDDTDDQNDYGLEQENSINERTINDIIIQGNILVSPETILPRIPYKKGEVFNPDKTNTLINNLFDLFFFSDIKVMVEHLDDDKLNLYVIVKEKPSVKEIIFAGNKNLSQKDINKKLKLDTIPAISHEELPYYVKQLKKLYREKNYHHVDIQPTLMVQEGKGTVNFTVKENKCSTIKRVFFEGNCTFTSKKLRSLLFTREDWILGFMDKAGVYHPDAIEGDKQALEVFYQSNGFFNAKVTGVDVKEDEKTHELSITFHIYEGDLYTISSVTVPGNDLISEEFILERLTIKPGDLYSREKIKETLEGLRILWGEFGYIYADIEPSIQPNDDTKTVALAFYTELGNKVHLNRITISGNQKTRDRIIRRNLLLAEGDVLTTKRMDESKTRVEGMGYFEQRDGVNWKIHRIGEDKIDLDLIVQEIKTGKLDVQLGLGGAKDITNPTEGLRLGLSFSDINFLGQGIGLTCNGAYSKKEQELLFNLTQPWLFDKPIYAAVDVAARRSVYDELKNLKRDMKEQLQSASVSLGYVIRYLNDTRIIGQFGAENINFAKRPEVNLTNIMSTADQSEYAAIVNNRFRDGSYIWLGGNMAQDTRNHPTHPSRGYQWLAINKLAMPNDAFAFFKADLDISWYTPLINERDLVLCLHSHFGAVAPYAHKNVPFRELYHIGGIGSVRGFTFGEIGPTWRGDSIGAQYAFWLNAELIFPVSPDFSLKGVVFYDGGSGWATPLQDIIPTLGVKRTHNIKNNHFNYRHAIGFGIRLYKPTPLRIDWGFKLDRRKGESSSEVHLGAAYEF